MSKRTYADAQQEIFAGLARDGWALKLGLKVPQAVSPDGMWKLFFKAQAIYLAREYPGSRNYSASLKDAHSLHLDDIREGTYATFAAHLARWTAESGRGNR